MHLMWSSRRSKLRYKERLNGSKQNIEESVCRRGWTVPLYEQRFVKVLRRLADEPKWEQHVSTDHMHAHVCTHTPLDHHRTVFFTLWWQHSKKAWVSAVGHLETDSHSFFTLLIFLLGPQNRTVYSPERLHEGQVNWHLNFTLKPRINLTFLKKYLCIVCEVNVCPFWTEQFHLHYQIKGVFFSREAVSIKSVEYTD